MNLKQNKQRTYQEQTPVKKGEKSIQLTNYFSRPSQDLGKKNINSHIEWSQKQNIDPNTDIERKSNHIKSKQNNGQNSNQITPKRKVIHLKSISKNSKSVKDGNSNSLGKKMNAEHNYTQVAEFSDQVLHNRPAIKIDIDLKGHRKSMQDTLVSSNVFQSLAKPDNTLVCDQHMSKKATFMVKGRPFCDKCSVRLITKGFVAIRIKNQQDLVCEVPENDYQSDYKKCDQQRRDMDLKKFIQQLDKMEPILDVVGSKIDSYLSWLVEYFQFQSNKFEENWNQLMKFLESFKYHLTCNFHAQEEKAHLFLVQARQKIKQQTNSLSFMRNDIVRNIDRIIDESTVPYQKYVDVMENFKMQLADVQRNAIQIQKSNLLLPRSEIDLHKLEDEFHKSFNLKYVEEELFPPSLAKSPSTLGSADDPYRLSFGKDGERVQSPTFKIL